MKHPMYLFGYILGTGMFIFGLLILFGVFQLRQAADTSLGPIFGSVLLLFGIYRVAVTDMKRRNQMRQERLERSQMINER